MSAKPVAWVSASRSHVAVSAPVDEHADAACAAAIAAGDGWVQRCVCSPRHMFVSQPVPAGQRASLGGAAEREHAFSRAHAAAKAAREVLRAAGYRLRGRVKR